MMALHRRRRYGALDRGMAAPDPWATSSEGYSMAQIRDMFDRAIEETSRGREVSRAAVWDRLPDAPQAPPPPLPEWLIRQREMQDRAKADKKVAQAILDRAARFFSATTAPSSGGYDVFVPFDGSPPLRVVEDACSCLRCAEARRAV